MEKIILTSTDAQQNLDLERSLLTKQGEFFLLWRNAPSVIIGKNQLAENEVNVEFANENGVKIVQRITGGGAVYHDLGNVNFSFILNENRDFGQVCEPVVNALARLGVGCTLSGKNDITANGKKISGNARRLHFLPNGEVRLLHHGTLLFDCDLEMMEKVLMNGGKRSRSVASNKEPVANIRPMLSRDMTVEEFVKFMFDNVIL